MWKLLGVGLAVVLLLEASYWFYLIDFYRPEFEAHNGNFDYSKDQPTILFLGDSFTGNAESYVSYLRKELGFSINLINGAVSGTGIIETGILAPHLIEQYAPDVVVYQIYVGNDLLDIKHRISGESGLLRRCYYTVSDNLRVFKFLNYRLGQWRGSVYQDLPPQEALQGKSFAADSYNKRQRLIFKEEPDLLSNTLSLSNGREGEFEKLVDGISELQDEIDENSKLVLLVIPHCAQVSDKYHDRMMEMGMSELDTQKTSFYEALRTAIPNVTMIDPLAEFQRLERSGMELYYQDDPHLSHTGQEEIAKLVEPILLKMLDE